MAKAQAKCREQKLLANTQNAITAAYFSAITLNECDYVVTASILISYAFKWT